MARKLNFKNVYSCGCVEEFINVPDKPVRVVKIPRFCMKFFQALIEKSRKK